MPPLSILLKPASSGCNLRCASCFYADAFPRLRRAQDLLKGR